MLLDYAEKDTNEIRSHTVEIGDPVDMQMSCDVHRTNLEA